MKKLLFALLIGLVANVYGHTQNDTTIIKGLYRSIDSLKWGELLYNYDYGKPALNDSISVKRKILYGSVIDDGVSKVQFKADTIPVIMMVTDTSQYNMRDIFINLFDKPLSSEISLSTSFEAKSFYTPYPLVIIGYEVKSIEPITFSSGQRFYPGIPTHEYKTAYLNHLKQHLPERLIVWMAVRRKEK